MQRRILPLFPKEFGEYMLAGELMKSTAVHTGKPRKPSKPITRGCLFLCAGQRGFEATADVAVVGPPLKVLDADLAFEVRPA